MQRLVPVVVMFVILVSGCQRIKTKLGIGETITNPEPGSPEKVIQDVLRAAKMEDEEEGWQQFSALLHSDETELPSSLNAWREFKFRAIRKKADYLLLDKIAYTYKLMDKRDDGKSLRVYLANSASDMPTPCILRQDPSQGNAWRVWSSCF